MIEAKTLNLSKAAQAVAVLSGAVIIALLAQIKLPLPFSPVPITGQTFGVLLIPALLGRKLGVATLMTYLTAGLIGLPFFAATSWATGGYLIGFLFSAYVVGTLAENGWGKSFGKAIAMFLIGLIPIYAIGLLWLGQITGYDKVLMMGLYPFLPGAAIKVVAAASLLPLSSKAIR